QRGRGENHPRLPGAGGAAGAGAGGPQRVRTGRGGGGPRRRGGPPAAAQAGAGCRPGRRRRRAGRRGRVGGGRAARPPPRLARAQYFSAHRFLDARGPVALWRSPAGTLLDLPNSGDRGLGWALAPLAGLGPAALARRRPGLLALLPGPVLLALAASALRRYP